MSYTTDLFGNKIRDLSINLEVPSLDPADSGGSTGSVSLSTDGDPDFFMWPGRELLVNERLRTAISSVSLSDEVRAAVSAEFPLYLTNVHRTIRPFVGTLQGALTYLGGLVGLTFTATPVGPTPVLCPGFEGNLWVYLKHFLTMYGYEPVANTSGTNEVFFRPVRSGGTLTGHVTDTARSLGEVNLAKFVEVNYYNNKPVTNGQVYPLAGVEMPQDQTVFQVSAGETLEVDIQVSAWLSSVNQPVAQDYVNSTTNWSGTSGAYAIAGGDGTGVLAANWLGEGGRLSLALTDDPSVLRMILIGPRPSAWAERVGPFSVAATSGNTYSSLRITGTGVTFFQESLRIATGAGGPLVSEDVGATVDNPFIATKSQAYDLGIRTAQAYAGAHYGLDNSYGPHDEVSYAQPGMRIDGDRVKFRARSASISQGKVGVSAERDTTFADFNSVYTGKTFADFNTANSGMTFGQWAAVPLNI